MIHVSPLDACGIMIRAAAVLGKYHAERGFRPYLNWNTDARQRAYNEAYRALPVVDHRKGEGL